jgi:hypothetical protein
MKMRVVYTRLVSARTGVILRPDFNPTKQPERKLPRGNSLARAIHDRISFFVAAANPRPATIVLLRDAIKKEDFLACGPKTILAKPGIACLKPPLRNKLNATEHALTFVLHWIFFPSKKDTARSPHKQTGCILGLISGKSTENTGLRARGVT